MTERMVGLPSWGSFVLEQEDPAQAGRARETLEREPASDADDRRATTNHGTRNDTPLGGLTRLSLKANPHARNGWLSLGNVALDPSREMSTARRRGGESAVPGPRPYRLTLPTRGGRAIAGSIGALSTQPDAAVSQGTAWTVNRWAVTEAVGKFLSNREGGLLDFSECNPQSEVLQNLFGTDEQPANPYVAGSIMQRATSIKFPRGMQCVPKWVESLWTEPHEIRLPWYQGECVDMKNGFLGKLIIDGPCLREIHVPRDTHVQCPVPNVRIYRNASD